MDASTFTTKNAWQERRDMVTLLRDLVEKQERVMKRLARYRVDNAPPGRDRLTQEDASELAGVAVRQWQRWEAGETMPHPRNLEQLAEKLEIPITDFIGVDEKPKGETPDLMGHVNGDRRDADLQTQLDRIEQKLDDLRTFAEKVDNLDGYVREISGATARVSEDLADLKIQVSAAERADTPARRTGRSRSPQRQAQ